MRGFSGLAWRTAVWLSLVALSGSVGAATAAPRKGMSGPGSPAPGGSGPSLPAQASIVQGGIVTLPVVTDDTEYSDGAYALRGPPSLSAGSDDPDAPAYADRIGYEFTNMGAGGGNLTLYVGSAVPTGTYTLRAVRKDSGGASPPVFRLRVLPTGRVHVIGPGANVQQALDRLRPGEVLELRPGSYSGDAKITISGTRERPITIRSRDHAGPPPVLRYAGTDSNQWEIRGSHLIVEGLAFASAHTDPIRIRRPVSGRIDGVTIVGSTFVDCGGICVTANDPGTAYANVRILGNLVLRAHRTAFYVGQQNGRTPVSDFVFEGNVVDARLVDDLKVEGYGIEVKLNARDATLRNNYILGTQGPGIMTYGLQAAAAPGHASVVDRNIVIGACTDQNILTGAGPAIVSNNLAIRGHQYGYGLQDYQHWHRLAGVRYRGNTSILNRRGGFWFDSDSGVSGLADLRMVNNRAYPAAGMPGFVNLPPDVSPAVIAGNTEDAPLTAMAAMVATLQTRVPSPAALRRSVWPLLAGDGPLSSAQVQRVLKTLVALPDQSRNPAPRVCAPSSP